MRLKDIFQITCAKPGFLAGGKTWLDMPVVMVQDQFEDNDLDVAYYTQVGIEFEFHCL